MEVSITVEDHGQGTTESVQPPVVPVSTVQPVSAGVTVGVVVVIVLVGMVVTRLAERRR